MKTIGIIAALAAALGAGTMTMKMQNHSEPKQQSTMGAPAPKDNKAARAVRPKPGHITWDHLNIENKSPNRKDKISLTDAEWKTKLSPDQFKILRSHGTDPAFCGLLEDTEDTGIYYCAGCALPLFVSDDKFHSGTGWPSFFEPYARENVWFVADHSYGMERVEVRCARCDGHLGHVFPDGPKPTGVRYCINGNALKFVPDKTH